MNCKQRNRRGKQRNQTKKQTSKKEGQQLSHFRKKDSTPIFLWDLIELPRLSGAYDAGSIAYFLFTLEYLAIDRTFSFLGKKQLLEGF